MPNKGTASFKTVDFVGRSGVICAMRGERSTLKGGDINTNVGWSTGKPSESRSEHTWLTGRLAGGGNKGAFKKKIHPCSNAFESAQVCVTVGISEAVYTLCDLREERRMRSKLIVLLLNPPKYETPE
jgi:hypothetical protein